MNPTAYPEIDQDGSNWTYNGCMWIIVGSSGATKSSSISHLPVYALHLKKLILGNKIESDALISRNNIHV